MQVDDISREQLDSIVEAHRSKNQQAGERFAFAKMEATRLWASTPIQLTFSDYAEALIMRLAIQQTKPADGFFIDGEDMLGLRVVLYKYPEVNYA